MTSSDFLMIERVLYALWAPNDADPKRRAELINDATADHLTINDVVRARRALERLRCAAKVPVDRAERLERAIIEMDEAICHDNVSEAKRIARAAVGGQS